MGKREPGRRGEESVSRGRSDAVKTVRKLIEVALPLDDLNRAAAREKSIRHGHPSTLHLWWARRPLAAARAVLFAQLVDDPSSRPELFPTELDQARERERLFAILRDLVKWENTTNEAIVEVAREEIRRSWERTCADNADHPRASELFDPERLPAFHDPFAGGGAIPLEAQRLGLEAHASDLNPVAVLINKAMIEIPPKFAGRPPVNPESRGQALGAKQWKGAAGLAEDVRYYGQWMRDEAERRIGHLYPKVRVTEEMAAERPDLERYAGRELTVIAWLWARTVHSPNPAFADIEVPLVSNFMLSTKKGKEAWVEPIVEGRDYRFEVRVGPPPDVDAAKAGTKINRGNFRCLISEAPIPYAYIDDEANGGRMGSRLMAVVVQGDRRRIYLSAQPDMDVVARSASPLWKPDLPSRGTWASNAQGRRYGFHTFGDYFTARQLTALTTLSDLVSEAKEKAHQNALSVARTRETVDIDLHARGHDEPGPAAYADAVSVYLALLVDQVANHSSVVCGWNSPNGQMRSVFARQAITMVWDYAEANPFAASSGSYANVLERQVKAFTALAPNGSRGAEVRQADAIRQTATCGSIVSTDPPYYDNIGYGDLSDFFYVWLRNSIGSSIPDLFTTLATPKSEELIASEYRHGDKERAEEFFLDGMRHALSRLASQAHREFPVSIYYAFKQSETMSDAGVVRTGWETFLHSVVESGFGISGTWPIRTEKQGRVIGYETNALASSIVVVCRPRRSETPSATRQGFVKALKRDLRAAILDFQRAGIAPVDLAQATIGPGMATYTGFTEVRTPAGQRVGVGEALSLINEVMEEILSGQEAELDSDTRWAVAWYETHGFGTAPFGEANTLATAKNTSVAGLVEAGILHARSGQVRLLRPEELPEDWNPATDRRLTVWEMVQHLVRVLEREGEIAAGKLLRRIGGQAGAARELAYRLYGVCERQKRAAEAFAYNSLVISWPELTRIAQEDRGERQALF